MIEFKVSSSVNQVGDYVISIIGEKLSEGQTVLWMVAGGSAMDIACKASEGLKKHHNLKNLTVTLTDERYGPVGHANSNWRQLEDKGFKLPGAVLIPVLSNNSLGATVSNFQKRLNETLDTSDYSVALAGMGPDGHIFGIKPGSPSISDGQGVVGYEWEDYIRITPTINLIKRLDEVIIYAAGPEKHGQIDMIKSNISPDQQPAQLLKQLERVTFYNDYKEEKL